MHHLNLIAQAQTVSPTQELQTLLKYAATSVEVANVLVRTLPLEPNTPLSLSLEGLSRLQLVVVRSAVPISYTCHQEEISSVMIDMWSAPALLHYVVFDNFIPAHLILRSATAAQVDVIVAARLPAAS